MIIKPVHEACSVGRRQRSDPTGANADVEGPRQPERKRLKHARVLGFPEVLPVK